MDSKVTALIGKNESGKSNILEAIGKLSFLNPMDTLYYNNKNRGSNKDISVNIELDFYQSEIDRLDIEQSKTIISFIDNSTVKLEGGLSDLIKNDRLLIHAIEGLVALKGKRTVWGTDNSRLNLIEGYINEFNKVSEVLIYNAEVKLNNLKQWILSTFEDIESIKNVIDTIQSHISSHYSLLPKLYYREEDKILDSNYKYEDIKNIIKDQNHIFYRFLLAAEIEVDEVIKAFENISDGEKQNVKNMIGKKVKNNIEKRFNEFYSQERIEIQTVIEGNLFKIYVLTDDKTMNLSERSNGLRWYLSLFVDVLSRNYNDNVVVYLLDEPGVYLHVNAQRELMSLFLKLADSGNQIIYTTHSPSMIDSQEILNVRAIKKDENGNTKIFNTAYNQELSKESKMETLSPLLKAIGSDLKFSIGPYCKKNIITEGITDYMYMKAILNYMDIKEQPNIIPSTGASNINRIASILMGWGCDFMVLLDYDYAGFEEYQTLIRKLDESLEDKIKFVNCVQSPDIDDMKINPKTIESLIDKTDYHKLSVRYDGTSDTKKLSAKEFHDKANLQEFQISDVTISNFEKLFNQFGILKND